VCNPAPVSGNEIAARAGYRFGSRGDPAVTGSVKRSPRAPVLRSLRGRDEVYDGLSRAVAGED